MAGERHSDSDGSDIFWPGYVDAVTNLVLNLLFLLTIMTVAVFMFALELGRASLENKTTAASKKDSKTVKAAQDPVQENIALKREIERLNLQLAQQAAQKGHTGVVQRTVDVSAQAPKATNRLERVAASDSEVIVRFSEDAIAFSPAEHDRLREALKPIAAAGRAGIVVEAPAGFTEAKRMAFYRAMAVRNLLIEMNMPTNSIEVAVHEVKTRANPAQVKVRAR